MFKVYIYIYINIRAYVYKVYRVHPLYHPSPQSSALKRGEGTGGRHLASRRAHISRARENERAGARFKLPLEDDQDRSWQRRWCWWRLFSPPAGRTCYTVNARACVHIIIHNIICYVNISVYCIIVTILTLIYSSGLK